MRKRDEGLLQRKICTFLKLRGIEYINPPMYKKSDLPVGWPDFSIFLNGIALFVEAKKPGEKARDNQVEKHLKLKQSGFRVFVIDNMEDFEKIYNYFLQKKSSII